MSAIAASTAALTRLLDTVDDGKLRQVVGLVEASGQRRTLEPALAALRPRLRRLRPSRPLTLPRLLTVPFETALVLGPAEDWPFAIGRARLGDWHRSIIEGLDRRTRDAATALIEGRAADDRAAILEAGAVVWPHAAAALAGDCPPGEPAEDRTARRRAADLLAIAVDLVPLQYRLQAPLGVLDGTERATVAEILALAQGGPPDRLGLLTMLLLRATTRPLAIAPQLVELAPAPLRPRLRQPLDQLLARHREDLERRVAAAAAADDLPLERVANELWRLADVLVGPEGQAAEEVASDPSIVALRQQAATVAEAHYAASIMGLVAPLPETADDARAAAVKAREAGARRLARLGRAARRLAPDNPIQRLTEAALRHLVDRGPTPGADPRPRASVDDARLVEILAGPELAWQLLRPHAARR